MMGKREKKKRQRRKGVKGGVRGEKMEQRKRKKKENRARYFDNSVGNGNQYQGNSEFLIQKFYRTCFK